MPDESKMKWMKAKEEKKYISVCVLLLNVFNLMVVSRIKMKKIGKWWWWSGALASIWQKWTEPRDYVYIWTSDDILLSVYVYETETETYTYGIAFQRLSWLTSHATSISVSFCSSSVIIYCSEDLNFDAQLIDMHASVDAHDQLGSVSVWFDLDKY
jgi:hypothetical protein